MSSLPSFVELMSSLGLEDGASLPARSFLRPRSHSNASSSSDIDDERDLPHQQYANAGAYLFVSALHDRRDRTPDIDVPRVSRHGKDRYSPYPIAAIPRKGSSPALFEAGKAKRAPSTSPLPSPRSRVTHGSRSSPNGRVSPRRGSETWSHEADLHATTPISTYLRRKSPQMSPTSATFPRSASDEPMAPVAIPALPPLLSSFIFPQPVPEPSSPSEILEPQVLMATTAAAD
ncbi:hypothetical protein BJV78DRAFT_1280320 [Lactifluus subvellereus]|nr:hypothetical protein BJV78DRAFT_1280320 [Lactifluus subvellereus]